MAGCVAPDIVTSSIGTHATAPAQSSRIDAESSRLPLARPAQQVALADEGGAYDALIAKYAAENGVPLPLAHAVIAKESGYNASATGRGTIGLMQIKPATAKGIGFRGTAEELYEPETNLAWGMKYLGGAYELGGGDVCGTALRYQGGHRATSMTSSAQRYCSDLKKIMAKNG